MFSQFRKLFSKIARATPSDATPNSPQVENMEARVLFSADLPWIAHDTSQIDAFSQNSEQTEQRTVPLAAAQGDEYRQSFVVFDASILNSVGTDADDLSFSLKEAGYAFTFLDSNEDGLHQLVELAAQSEPQNEVVNDMRFYTAANDDGLIVGNSVVTVNDLLNQADALSAWRDWTDTDASISFNVANIDLLPDLEAYVDVFEAVSGGVVSFTEFSGIDGLDRFAEQRTSEIVFIDEGVEDYQTLLDGIVNGAAEGGVDARDFEIVILASDSDGIHQISAALAGREDIDAVHIIAHGDDGRVTLGTAELNARTFLQREGEIAAWASAFDVDGDLLIYGCNLAASEDGQRLINQLAGAAGVDVAASADLTGHASLGGDWDLEYESGEIETAGALSLVTQQRYEHTLDIATGLVAHYEFEEGSGTTATDSAGGDNTGTHAGSPTPIYSSGIKGSALDFGGGDDDSVNVADAANLDFGTGDFSVSFWFKSDSAGGDERLVGKGEGGGLPGFALYNDSFGDTNFLVSDGTSSITLSGSGYQDNNWHHVTAVRSGNSFELYIDDVMVDSGSASIGSVDNDQDLIMGASSGGATEYDGLLDEVRIFDRALSTADIGELYIDVNNKAPIATNDVYATQQDTPITFNPLRNDTDPEGDAITIVEVGQPANGVVVDNGDGTFTYTPNPGYSGADSLSYVLTDTNMGLQNYWGFDADASDSMGGLDGTISGATAVAGDTGQALSFDEVDDYALMPDVSYGNEFTISFDFKLDDNSGALFQYLYSHGDINSTNSINVFVTEDAHGTDPNMLRTVIRDANDTLDNAALQFDISSIVGDGEWHTYTVTAGPDGITVFLDGVEQAADASRATEGVNPTGGLFVGARQDLDPDRRYGGELDTLAIYDTALDSNQVATVAGHQNVGTVEISVGNASTGTAIWRASSDTTPNVSDWNGSAFTGTTDANDMGQWRIVEAAGSTTRDEIIAVGVDNVIGQIKGQLWDGTNWTDLPFNTLAFSSDSFKQNFDVAYESQSGDAIVIWANGSSGTNISYRVWDGSNWSNEATIAGPNLSWAVETRLEASPTSDEMVLIVSDSSNTEWAVVWDGDSWGNATVLDNSSASGDHTEIAVAFESQSGHAMVIYDGVDNYNDLAYQTWNGSSWSGQQTLALPFNGLAETDVEFTAIAADPNSDRLAIGVVTAGTENQVVFAVWDGSNWGDQLMATNASSASNSMSAAVGFEGQSGQLLVTYSEVSTTPRYQTWSESGGWSGEMSLPDIGGYATVMTLSSDPATDAMMLGIQDDQNDLNYVFWNGTSWETPNELTTDTGESVTRPFAFVFDQAGSWAPNDLEVVATDSGGLELNTDGGNDAYLLADNGGAILGGLTALTAEVRFSMESFPNSTNFFSYATGADDNVFKFNIRDDGDLSVSINSVKINSSAMDYRTLADGQPHTLSVTWNSAGGLWEMFVDGVSVDSGSGLESGVTLAGGGALVIGNDQDTVDGGYDPAAEVAATLYDARIFSDVRSAGEISTNYDQTLASTETGMLANWTFNELTTGGVVVDAVSGNNLTVKHASGAGFNPSVPVLSLVVSENDPNGTVVGTVGALDPDGEDSFAYALTDDAGGRFAINGTSGQITLADTNLVDYETATTHDVTVRVTDGAGLTYDEVFTIAVVDTNDDPVIVTDGGGDAANVNVVENTTAVTTVTASDADLDTPTYTISGGEDSALFGIDSVSGALTFLSAPDYETPLDANGDNVYEVVVQAADGNGGVDTQTINVTVTNAAPTLVSATGAGTVIAGSSYTLNLSADETVTSWTINWGDGSIETIAGNPSSVTHTYDANYTGFTVNILASASDGTGDYFSNELVAPTAFATGEGLYRYTGSTGAFSQYFGGAEITNPYAVAVGPDGLLYVAGHTSDNVVRYDATTGAYIDEFVAVGSGGLNAAAGLAFGADGHLYVSNQIGDSILKYDGSTGAYLGTFVTSGSGGLDGPAALSFGADGYLYVGSYNSDSVLRYDATTGAFVDTFVTTGSGGLNGPGAMTWGSDGHLYVGGTNSVIKRFDGTTGAFIDDFVTAGSGGLGESIGLTFGPDGHLYVSSFTTDKIIKYDGATGALLGDFVTVGSGGLDGPTSFTFLPNQQVTVLAGNSTPVIASDGGGDTANVNVVENTIAVTTVAASDSDLDALTYTISGGADNALFGIDSVSGALTFLSAPDYETPLDANGDNIYEVVVQVADGNGGVDTQTINVTVVDVSHNLVVTTTANTNDGDTSSAEALNASKGVDNAVSLYEAITAANNSSETVTISFNITDALVGGAHTFAIGPGGLPAITDTVIIDGTTDPDYAGTPIIVLDGSGAGAVDGLRLAAGSDGSTVRGLVINQFGDTGITLIDSDNHTIAGNYIGTDASGTVDLGNASKGIQIENSSGNQIGGASAMDRNVISGNDDDGIIVWGSGSTLNVIQGNYVGIDASGDAALGNTGDGIVVSGGAGNNTIGGDRTAGEGNVLSGNSGANSDGIEIDNTGADNNKIYGNYIGTNHDGTTAIANARHGVVIYDGVQGTEIGGTGAGEGNIISGNTQHGVVIDGNGVASTSGNLIQGNYIGLSADGASSIFNGVDGVHVFGGAQSNTIGGTTPSAGNVISGNHGAGVYITGVGTDSNVVQGNYFGTDATGTASIHNWSNNVNINQGASHTLIGGSAAGAGNVIAFSGNDGITIWSASTTGTIVQGNYIGTDVTGTLDLGNSNNGVVVSGNSSNNLIGGIAAGEANVVANNGGDGVRITDSATDGNSILGNVIHSNDQEGIDLANDGVTSNDPNDADSGANSLQNFPVITLAELNSTDLTLSGSLDTDNAGTQYRIEFFGNADGSQDATNGEARVYLGAVTVTTDGSGDATFSNVTLSGVTLSVGDYVTATATKVEDAAQIGIDNVLAFGSTSEFGTNFVVAAFNAPPVLSLPAGTTNYSEGATVFVTPSATVTDIDSADFDGGQLTVTISAGGEALDRLYINSNGTDPGQVLASGSNLFYNDGGGSIQIGTISGGYGVGDPLVVTFNSSATADGIAAVAEQVLFWNTSEAPSTTSRTVTMQVTDGDGGTSAVQTRTIDVTPVNDAPVLASSGGMFLTSITEDDLSNSGNLISEIIASAGGDAITDVDAGALEGIAITSVDNSNGTWQYNTGAGWTDVGSVSFAESLLLRDTDRLRFVPDGENADTAFVTFSAWDQTAGTEGTKVDTSVYTSTGAFSFSLETASIIVTAVNDAPSGSVTIDNMSPAEGDLLTVSDTLVDVDGLGTITYTWKADGAVVGTGSTYTTGQSDVGRVITVEAAYTDDGGTNEIVASVPTAAVTNVDQSAVITGDVSYVGNEGDIASGDLNATDADGLSDTAYFSISSQGLNGTAVIDVETGAWSFTPDDPNWVGSDSFEVTVTDDLGGTTTQVVTVDLSNVNDAPAGSVTIDNAAPAQGDTLTASNTLTDADGLSGPITYQWFRDGVAIAGATANSYVTTQTDVGTVITVTATYTDDQGTAESVTSAGTAPVTNVNDPVSGQPVITGTPEEDQTLTADTSGISDTDGLGAFSYQWYRDGVAIGGATASTYLLGDADVDTSITVEVSYADGYGTGETTTSAAVGPVTNVNDSPMGSVTIDNTTPAQGETLSASNTLTDADGLSGPISYQWYRDGVAIGGGVSNTYTAIQADVGAIITVEASYTDDQGTAETVTSAGTAPVTNVNDPVSGQPVVTGTPEEDQTLTADTSGISDVDGLGTFSYQWYRDGVAVGGATSTTYLLGDADVGSNVTVEVSYTDGQGSAESTMSAAVGPVTNVNDAPAGSVLIDNTTPAQGDLLTATNTLTDADGFPGTIDYQWFRDGVAIGGANSNTYTTVQLDVGAVLTVVASYTDDQGTAEAVTSAGTAPVTNVNDPVSGQPVIVGTPEEDQTLSADTSGISDADGLGVFSHQWYRDGVAIGGATASTYLLGDADVDANITVQVSYTDGLGSAESTTSTAVGPVTNVNDAPVGSVTIDNMTPAQGDTLTVSNTLADADGLSGPITYQWFRDGVAIAGATVNSYVATQTDVDTVITVTATYTDDQGTAESVTSAGTAPVTNVNDPVSGQPVITGTPEEDQTLTADISGISDADGLGAFSFQWYRDGVAVGGATGSTYVLGDGDVDASITVEVSFTDSYGTAETTTSAAVGPVTNVNDSPLGSVTIDNTTPAQGDTLTASNTLSDADGLSGSISYQWYRDGVIIAGATANTYVTTQLDVGTVITVEASYTDDQGTAESVTSAATTPITNVNDPVSGQPVIAGIAEEDQILTADTSGINDVDGLGTFNYQWYRDGVAISGATASTYLLGDADVDANITVQVYYTDGQGSAESTVSAAVGPVVNVNDLPMGSVTIDNTTPAQGDTLTVSNTLTDADGLSGPITYQWFRDGIAIAGATANSYVATQTDVGTVITVTATYTDDQGTAESVTSAGTAPVTNVNDPVSGQPVITGTPEEDQTLTADISGISDADGLGAFSFQWYRDGVAITGATASTHLLGDADVDTNITVQVSYTDGQGSPESTTSTAVGPVTNVNDAPGGSVTIDNMTPAQGDTLTASNTLSDADGLSGPITYQWYRDGVAIGGATSSSYVTTQADVGAIITVHASYTDDQGTAESVASMATAAVTNINDPVVGQPIITGTLQEDQTLAADVSGISDTDGLGAFSYQWYRDGIAVGGATASTYLLDDADVGASITVVVSYTDGQGSAESTTSAAVGPITNINDVPVGSVTIDNTIPAQGATLTVSNTLTDADGLGPISYQWYRDGALIAGATANTYTTTQTDVGAVISVEASYTDDQGTAESVTSAGTAPVTNVNDPVSGQPVIIGTPEEDQTLMAETSGISDVDGLGTFNYQWYRDGVAIGGATASTYLLGDADVDADITVQVFYTDGQGTAESVVSVAVGPVTNVNDVPAGTVAIDNTTPAQGDTLTASNTLTDADGLSGSIAYQWYRDGVAIGGAGSNVYTTTQLDVGAVLTVTASYTDDQGTAESVTSVGTSPVTNVNDPVSGQPVISGTPVEDQTLTADISGISDADGLGTFNYQWYRDGVAVSGANGSTYVLGDADVDANITVEVSYTDGQGTAESTVSAAVGPVTNVNDAPAGSVTIDNAAPAQGDTLTASNTLTDADGLSGPITYQWFRDGVAIAGATANSYVTTQTDVGTVITVTATYTDDQGTAESVTSAGTAPVTNVNDPVSGQPVITGTPEEDQTLTADTSGISDTDGLGAFSYQWYRDGVAIGGATASTYLLGDADVDTSITVEVSYADGYGTGETTTSAAVGPVTNVNDSPMGSVTIDNTTPAQGETLSASNTLTDADGLSGPIGYQWYRDGVAISGATSNTFVTTQSDVGATLTVVATYVDDRGTTESVASAPTTAVANVNDSPVAVDDVLTTNEDTNLIIDVSSTLLANDTDPDSDVLTMVGFTQPAQGILMDNMDGTLTYVPDADFNGTDQFTYTITDAGGISSTAIASITVNAVNDAPLVSTPTLQSIREDLTSVVQIQALDAEGDALSYRIAGGEDAQHFGVDPQTGLLQMANPADFEHPRDADADNVYRVVVEVSDTQGGRTLVPIDVQVADVNEAPQLADADFSALASNLPMRLGTLTADDPDSGETLTYSITGGNQNDWFAIDATSGDVMSDFAAEVGIHTLQITVTDSAGNSTQATLSIEIVASPDTSPPVVADTSGTEAEETTTDESTQSNDDVVAGVNDQNDPNDRDEPSEDGDRDAQQESPPAVDETVFSEDSPVLQATGADSRFVAVESSTHIDHVQDRSLPQATAARGDSLSMLLKLVFNEGDNRFVFADQTSDSELNVQRLRIPVSPELAVALNELNHQMMSDGAVDLRVTGAVVGSVSLSAGFVVWMLRAGSLVASLISTRPAWSDFDPLPIFEQDAPEWDLDHNL